MSIAGDRHRMLRSTIAIRPAYIPMSDAAQPTDRRQFLVHSTSLAAVSLVPIPALQADDTGHHARYIGRSVFLSPEEEFREEVLRVTFGPNDSPLPDLMLG